MKCTFLFCKTNSEIQPNNDNLVFYDININVVIHLFKQDNRTSQFLNLPQKNEFQTVVVFNNFLSQFM